MIETGQPGSDLTLSAQDGNEVTLSSLRGKPVVVYFSPRQPRRVVDPVALVPGAAAVAWFHAGETGPLPRGLVLR